MFEDYVYFQFCIYICGKRFLGSKLASSLVAYFRSLPYKLLMLLLRYARLMLDRGTISGLSFLQLDYSTPVFHPDLLPHA